MVLCNTSRRRSLPGFPHKRVSRNVSAIALLFLPVLSPWPASREAALLFVRFRNLSELSALSVLHNTDSWRVFLPQSALLSIPIRIMSSRPNEKTAVSTTLAGLGATTQVAVAATDGIPIVNQVLAVLSNIIKLAQEIEKRRDALHELAETARSLGPSIAALSSEGELGGQVLLSIEALRTVLRAIETLFEKHKAKKAFHKALSYAFTTSKQIESLRQELSRAALQFQLVVALDSNARLTKANACLLESNALLRTTNAGVQEINVRVQEDSQYIGEFYRIQHCDVQERKLIVSHEVILTGYISKIYSAKVKGSVCILRCFERNSRVVREGESFWETKARREILEHDKLLEELSKVQASHPNIACLYGRSSGDGFERFNIMNLGCLPALNEQRVTPDWSWNIIRQVLDALCHLDQRGAIWHPEKSSPVFLDRAGTPIIGLNSDLRTVNMRSHQLQIDALGTLLEHGLRKCCPISHPSRPSDIMIVFGATPVPYLDHPTRYSIPRKLIPTLDDKMCGYLKTTLESCEDEFGMWVDTGPLVLRAAASRCAAVPNSYKQYTTSSGGRRDIAFMCHIQERGDEIHHLMACATVPAPEAAEMRTKLGIPLPIDSPDVETFISACNLATRISRNAHRPSC